VRGDLEVAEAEYHEMDLLVSKAEAILTQYPGVEPKEEDVARVETMRAQRHQRRVMLDQYHRKLRRGRAQVRALQAKRIIKGAIMFAIFLWIWSAWEKVQQDKAEAVAIQQHQVQQEPVPEPVPLPRAKPQ
jgi:hypothetical protein